MGGSGRAPAFSGAVLELLFPHPERKNRLKMPMMAGNILFMNY
jgi:hypothetical protein